MMSVLVRLSICTWPYFDTRSDLVKSGRHLRGLGVTERKRLEREAAGLRLPLGGGCAADCCALVLRLERRDPRDPDDRALDGVVELIAAQNDVERLIPRHVGQLDVDRSLHVRVDDHVQTADVGERAQHRAQVDTVEIEAQRIARVLAGC